MKTKLIELELMKKLLHKKLVKIEEQINQIKGVDKDVKVG